MLILYNKSTCPFCRRVEEYLDDKGIAYESRDISIDQTHLDELIEIGGKKQVPYLVDTERGVSMYESQDIIDYIQENYGEDPVVVL